MALDIHALEAHFLRLRERDFPMLSSQQRYIYLDSAATSLKPRPVIDYIQNFYLHDYATVHRAIYTKSQKATKEYDGARIRLQHFFNGLDPSEIIFTRGTTDSINIVQASLIEANIIRKDSTILISGMEHHSNIVPWQMAAKKTGANLVVIPLINDQLDIEALQKELEKGQVALVSLAHCANILGTINPIETLAPMIRKKGALLLVDGAQSAPHIKIDLQKLGADFFACSSHKMSGPTSVGILWGRKELLESLPPTRGGGDMIETVTFEKTTFGKPPLKFEPGTPPISEAIGFGQAILYLEEACGGIEAISEWEQYLTTYLRESLLQISPRISLIGNSSPDRGALQSFIVEGAHPLDVSTLLDVKGIAVRSGHLCGQPVLQSYGLTSVIRASIAYYNTQEDIDLFIKALKNILSLL